MLREVRERKGRGKKRKGVRVRREGEGRGKRREKVEEKGKGNAMKTIVIIKDRAYSIKHGLLWVFTITFV